MYISKEQNKKLKERKKELSKSISNFKAQGGGPVTFHFTKEIMNDKGITKKIPSHKQVVNMTRYMIKNKSPEQFIHSLQDLQHDLGADYFTL